MTTAYYLDCEFLEGIQTRYFLGIPYTKTKNTIDLISIGLISEDNRQYYAISNEFNLREAWNRYDLNPDIDNGGMKKVYWIRENVLKPIWEDYIKNQNVFEKTHFWNLTSEFSYKTMKHIIRWTGKSNKQIAEEVKEFCEAKPKEYLGKGRTIGVGESHLGRPSVDTIYGEWKDMYSKERFSPEFYVYFGDYDWVVFCWLFGKMINLPKSFPYYAKDLKQIMDEKAKKEESLHGYKTGYGLKYIKEQPDYPKQTNAHNSLSDAKFNKELHEFLNTLK